MPGGLGSPAQAMTAVRSSEPTSDRRVWGDGGIGGGVSRIKPGLQFTSSHHFYFTKGPQHAKLLECHPVGNKLRGLIKIGNCRARPFVEPNLQNGQGWFYAWFTAPPNAVVCDISTKSRTVFIPNVKPSSPRRRPGKMTSPGIRTETAPRWPDFMIFCSVSGIIMGSSLIQRRGKSSRTCRHGCSVTQPAVHEAVHERRLQSGCNHAFTKARIRMAVKGDMPDWCPWAISPGFGFAAPKARPHPSLGQRPRFSTAHDGKD